MYGNNGWTGFDIQTIKNLAGEQGVSAVLNELKEGVQKILQEQVIDKVAEFWYADEAQESTGKVVEIINGDVNKQIDDNYNSLVEIIQDATKYWQQATGNTDSISFNLSPKALATNNNSVQKTYKSGDGEYVGIDMPKSEDYIANIQQVKQQLTQKIYDSQAKLRQMTPFLGQGQEEAMQSVFTKLVDVIDEFLSSLIDGGGDTGEGIKKLIQSFNEEYQERAKSVASGISMN